MKNSKSDWQSSAFDDSTNDQQRAIDDLKTEIENVNVQLREKEDKVCQLEMEISILQNENQLNQDQLRTATTDNNSIRGQLDNLKSLLGQENDELRDEIAKLNELLEAKIKRVEQLEKSEISGGDGQELTAKIAHLESQNLKYKAKIKQLMSASKTAEKVETESVQRSSAPIIG